MTTRNASKATYHFYLCTAVLKEMESRNINIGDNFGFAEDTLVTELYPYTNLLYRQVEVLEDTPFSEWNESNLPDVATKLAAFFVDAVERQDEDKLELELPELDEFELDVKHVLFA